MNPNPRPPNAGAADKIEINDAELVRLLSQRFGDGLVYMAEDTDHEVLRYAMATGLVSPDGHLTTAGYRALKRTVRD